MSATSGKQGNVGQNRVDDWLEAAKIIIRQAKQDPINYGVLPVIGAGCLFILWYKNVISWGLIKWLLTHDL